MAESRSVSHEKYEKSQHFEDFEAPVRNPPRRTP